MKLKTTILILSLIALQISLKAQEKCLTSMNLQELTAQNPLLASGMNNLDNYIRTQMPESMNQVTSGKMNLIRIPVVVHIVYNPKFPDENISSHDIQSQIRILNENFRRNNFRCPDAMIEFYLADTDPEGNPSNGITRSATNHKAFYWQIKGGKDMTAVKYSSLGGIDAWDTGLYLNIWVCNLIYQTGANGYAQLPFYTGVQGELYEKASDGIVIDYKAFRGAGFYKYSPADMRRTTTHQTGHWLGLKDAQTKTSDLNFSSSYMNSCPDQNTNTFTKEQIAIMRSVLAGPRNSLINRSLNISLNVDQKLSDSSSVGSIGMWDGISFVPKTNLPAALSFKKGTSVVLKGDNEIYNNQKFHHWTGASLNSIQQIINVDNSTGKSITSQFEPVYEGVTVKNSLEGTEITGGQIGFKDPWLIDYKDSSFAGELTNQGMNALMKSKASPFMPSFTIPNNGDLHKGVFLNMSTSSSSYYTAKAIEAQDIIFNSDGKLHKFYFQKWAGNDVTFSNSYSAETPLTFTSATSGANAVLKGTHLSDNPNAFSRNGQRKFIMTPDGYLHLVYSSMGKVWYELSKDKGQSWMLMNSGKPLDEKGSKLPSIDYLDNNVIIAWQSSDSSGNSDIKLQVFSNISGEYTAQTLSIIPIEGSYNTEASPLVAWGYAGKAVLLWESKGSNGGLHYKYGQISSSGISWAGSGIIPGSDSTAVNASISCAKDVQSQNIFNLAWQQGEMPYAMIFYLKMQFNDMGIMDENVLPFFLSIYANFNTNVSPSIISVPGGGARMAWKGINEVGNDWGEYYVVLADPDNPWYMQYFNKYAGQVYSPQISLGSDTYIVGWSEPVENRYEAVCTNSSASIGLKSISGVDGRNIQINNGGMSSEMFVTAFRSENISAPYFFMQSPAIGTPAANKSAEPLSGRIVGLVKNSAQFYLTLGNIQSGKVNIHFKEVNNKDGHSAFTKYIETEPFMLSDKSSLSFTVRCGVKDSLAAVNALKDGKYISFKVEMVDDASGSVLGNYFDAKMDKENLFGMKESQYNVCTDGIGSKLVRLRIISDENIGAEYFIADRSTGKKAGLTQSATSMNVNYSGAVKVKEYSLSQNYPNPFNPSTQINYEVPKASNVTLKVYDMLGKEVSELVSGYKEEGRYTVQFDAKNLPSGMYIYQLRAGEYTSVRKMMLLK